jgi:hypothetical protein
MAGKSAQFRHGRVDFRGSISEICGIGVSKRCIAAGLGIFPAAPLCGSF